MNKPLPQSDIGHVMLHAPMRELQGKRVFVNGLGWFGGWVHDCLEEYGLRPIGRKRGEPFPATHFDFAIHAASSGVKPFLDFCETLDVPRSLYISSGAIYHREDEYALAKCADEKMCGEHPSNPVIARCYSFVGPRQKLDAHWAVGNFLADALAKRDITVKGDGSAIRSYMHMADLVVWLLTLLVRGKPGKPYNVGSDEALTIESLAYKVARYSGSEVRIEGGKNGYDCYVPASFSAQHDLSLATYIGIDDALERTWKWMN